MKKKIALLALIFDLVVINGLVGYLLWKIQTGKPRGELALATPVPASIDCTENCKLYTDTKIAELVLPTLTPAPKTKSTLPVPSKKTTSVEYFPVLGSGSTLANVWTDLVGTDFYFDVAEHPGLTDVRFEANIRLLNGNGQVAVRVYDVTHTMGVANSEVYSTSQTSVLATSGAINFWAGRNLYRVQAKSLTADTAIYDSGRLRIVVEK